MTMNNPEDIFDEQFKVLQFHQASGLTVGKEPGIRDAELRARLMLEEAIEFANAVGYTPTVSEDGTITLTQNGNEPDLVAAVDALCDELYVTYGAGVAFGIYLPMLFEEVHRSNMTKVAGEIVTREDGKIEKPDSYDPPHLDELIEQQRQVIEEVARQRNEFMSVLNDLMGDQEVVGIDNGDGTVEVPDAA